ASRREARWARGHRSWKGLLSIGPGRIRNPGSRRPLGDDPEGLAGEVDLETAVVAEGVSVDLDRERVRGSHDHLRRIVDVIDIPPANVPGRAEHLPCDP